MTQNGEGVDVNVSANNVDLGGAMVNGSIRVRLAAHSRPAQPTPRQLRTGHPDRLNSRREPYDRLRRTLRLSGARAVALLILFATSTRTKLVAPDLLLGARGLCRFAVAEIGVQLLRAARRTGRRPEQMLGFLR